MSIFSTNSEASAHADPAETDRRTYLETHLFSPVSEAVELLATRLAQTYPGSAVLIYGSGGSVLSEADPTSVLFDFYVIAPSYKAAFSSPLLRLAGWLIPPSVFYFKINSQLGELRAKYAVLSTAHFKKLNSKSTFHSYFWARFAQPFRVAVCPEVMRPVVLDTAERAIDTFLANAPQPEEADVMDLWEGALGVSYRAELRAEKKGRGRQLLESYGDWPHRVTLPALTRGARRRRTNALAWRTRSIQGGFLSVLRLLKATFTFEGGIDYITWKIKRHNGVEVPVRDWERRWPFIAAPIVAVRYYRLRNAMRKRGELST